MSAYAARDAEARRRWCLQNPGYCYAYATVEGAVAQRGAKGAKAKQQSQRATPSAPPMTTARMRRWYGAPHDSVRSVGA